MSRSLLLCIGLTMLGLGVVSFAQGTSADSQSSRWEAMLAEAEVRSQQGDIDGARKLLDEIRVHEDELTKVGRLYLESRLLRLREMQESRQERSLQRLERKLPGPLRYQLVGESGWVYRLDTATGEVLGVQVGEAQWQPISGTATHESPLTGLPTE